MDKAKRATLVTYMRTRGNDCREEARSDIEDALALILDPLGDPARIEDLLSGALVNMGEARGFFNTAADVESKEDT